MRCAECGTELLAGKRFCHACGAAAQAGCPSCGAAVDPGFRFCPDCGGSLNAAALVPPAPTNDPLTRHIPDDLARKIRGAAALAGERKRATVLFCDLVGSTAIADGLDPEVYREILDEYLEATFKEIYRFEGIVNQLAGDGFMALFGAPIAHEDDAERAVRAAVGIRTALSALSERLRRQHGAVFEARIGIHTGMVVVGTVGNDLKMDYTAIGDTTNLAARLQERAAPGTILISDATERLVRGRADTRPTGPFEVKGKAAPLRAHEVAGVFAARTYLQIAQERGLTPLVGRDEELAQLEACFQRLRGGLAQVISVVGDAGSGKSRLVYEFRRSMLAQHATLFEARCSSLTQNIPFAPWNAMLSNYVGIEPGDPPERVRERIELLAASGGLRRADDVEYLSRMLSGIKSKDPEDGAPLMDRTFEAYDGMVVTAARRGPTVMLIEELHWIDGASLDALERVMSRFGDIPFLLVVTHRPDFALRTRVEVTSTQIRLRALSDAHALEIVRARAGGNVPLALAERILRRGEGNPLFLEELTRALLDAGALESTASGMRTTRPVDAIEIPDTLQELLGARLDRLPAAAKRVAQIAAVFGRQVRRERLQTLLADEPIDLDRELDVLERNGVLHRKAGVGVATYRFGESLTQEVAYEALLLRERRQLHDRIAALYAADANEGDAARQVLVAHHYARGEQPWQGVHALLEAAERAEALPSYKDAQRLFAEAWELTERLLDVSEPDEAQLREALRVASGMTHALVMYTTTNEPNAERAARRGIELAKRLEQHTTRLRMESDLGFLIMSVDRTRFAEGLALIEGAVEEARGLADQAVTASLERGLAWAYLIDGRFDAARHEIAVAMAELERLGQRRALTDTYMGGRFFLSRVLFESDNLQAGLDYSYETLELAQRAANQTIEGAAEAAIAFGLMCLDRRAEALEAADRALAVGKRIQNMAAMRTALAVRVLVADDPAQCGDDERETLRRGLLSVGELAINIDLVISALLRLGELDAARRLVDNVAARAGGRLREGRNLVSLGEVATADGQLDAARQAYRQAIERGEAIGSRSLLARAWLGLAEVARARGATDEAREAAETARTLLEEIGLEYWARRARELARRCGDPLPVPA